MYRLFRILLLSSVVLAVSCTKSLSPETDGFVFSTKFKSGSGGYEDVDYRILQKTGFYVSYTNSDSSLSDDNLSVEYDDVKDCFKFHPDIYWPTPSTNLSFYASNHTITNDGGNYTIEYDQNVAEYSLDLICASASGSASHIPLEFEHALSKINSVQAKIHEDANIGYAYKLVAYVGEVLIVTPLLGTYRFSNGEWTATSWSGRSIISGDRIQVNTVYSYLSSNPGTYIPAEKCQCSIAWEFGIEGGPTYRYNATVGFDLEKGKSYNLLLQLHRNDAASIELQAVDDEEFNNNAGEWDSNGGSAGDSNAVYLQPYGSVDAPSW